MVEDIGILAVLILLNGLLSLSEMAVVSVSINKVRLRAEQGDKASILIKKIKENPTRFLSAIQIGITFLSIFSGSYAGEVFSEPIYENLSKVYPGIGPGLYPLVVFCTTVVVSYFTLVLGELVPKRLAMAKPLEISRVVVGFFNALTLVFLPFVKILTFSSELVIKLLRIKDAVDDDVTEEEIRMMVDASGETGGIDESEQEMINNVFEFDDKTAGDILTHRTKLVSLPADCGVQDIKNAVINERFSRIPVYEDTIDKIIGILYIHDLLEYILKDGSLDCIDLKKIIRKPYFVLESKKTDELFEQMQKDKIHMAVVVDEYGGTLGIVTMEDLVEEIMGNILDEFDEEDIPDIETLDQNTYRVDGTLSLPEVSEFFKIQLPVEEYDTLSGFFIGRLGHIPEETEKPEIEFADFLFKVNEMEEKRIKTIVVRKIA
ncbi:MAG: hemolysin family protein [Clostridiales bacterium]|nr:hemolysin family protein [Clostridiales bacterium]